MIRGYAAGRRIQDVPSPEDARITKLALTDSGRERLVQFETVLSRRLHDALPGLGKDAWAALETLYRSHVQLYRSLRPQT